MSKKPVKALTEMTDCICPKCGQTYQRRIEWVGNGVPRKFCVNCKRLIKEFSDDEVCFINNRQKSSEIRIH